MSEKGVSFVETLLTVWIVLLLAGTIIPFSYKSYLTLKNEKVELHASEAAYDASKLILLEGMTSGFKEIDGLLYEWDYDGQQLCVKYETFDEVKNKCIEKEGDL